MLIEELLGYKLTCIMSSDLKNESDYTDSEFFVVIYKDENSDSGYTATVSGITEDNESFSDEWDGDIVTKNIIFGSWIVKHKEKIR